MKLSIQLGILSIFNIGIGFLYQWYVFTQLGPGMQTDALFAGVTIPQLALVIVTGSLMNVLVPLLTGEHDERLRHDAWNILTLILGIFTFLVIILSFSAQWWVPLTVPGFSEAGKRLTVSLARIQLLSMIFSAVNSVQWATYHAREQFLWAEFTPVLSSVVGFILLVWALPRFGVLAAAWVFVLKVALQTLFLTPGMGKPVIPDLKSRVLKETWRRVKPLLIGASYYKTEPLVDRFLLSWANSGSLSLFYLAQRLYGIVQQICNKAIAAPLVPAVGKHFKKRNFHELRRVYRRRLLAMLVLGFVGLLVLGVAGRQILTLLIGYGHVTAADVYTLWWIMIWLSGTLIGGLAGQITSSTFYACGDTVTPTKLSMASYTIYLPLKVASFFLWGVAGLAVTTSIYYLINFLLQIYFMEKKQSSWNFQIQ